MGSVEVQRVLTDLSGLRYSITGHWQALARRCGLAPFRHGQLRFLQVSLCECKAIFNCPALTPKASFLGFCSLSAGCVAENHVITCLDSFWMPCEGISFVSRANWGLETWTCFWSKASLVLAAGLSYRLLRADYATYMRSTNDVSSCE